MHSILDKLNEKQRAAATHRDGPLVVFAGAGSGKTRIITHRIAYLVEMGVRPWNILAVTFTNKAASEMRERLQHLSPVASRALIATFHSACARWLREFAENLGFTADFSIYDDGDTKSALKKILKELNLPRLEGDSLNEYRHTISRLKNNAILPKDVTDYRFQSNIELPVHTEVIYSKYQEYLASCNAMDFDDLMMNMLLLLRNNADVRLEMQNRYEYILVDEYQDTNPSQFELISFLVEKNQNIFVVGDDDQSIYSWRGATPANILDFTEIYPGAKVIKLEQNYRSSKTIIDGAASLIANNKHRASKKIWTENELGEPIDIHIEYDGEMESYWVTDSIKEEKDNFSFNQVAVFYRTNSQSRSIEEALRLENIPYRIFGTLRFYDRVEIKDLLAFLRIIANPNDEVALTRIINIPTRGIGEKSLAGLILKAKEQHLGLYEALSHYGNSVDLRTAKKFHEFYQMMESIKNSINAKGLDHALETILERTGYLAYITKKYPENLEDKVENIRELGAALHHFAKNHPTGTVADYIQSTALMTDDKSVENGVSLMTLHMAKGLEYPRVYILGLEEGILPHFNSLERPEDIEEERRLMYVGMTRARQKLTLTCAKKRLVYNQVMANKASRFLQEIPKDLTAGNFIRPHEISRASLRGLRTDDEFRDEGVNSEFRYEFSEPETDLSLLFPGDNVFHLTYGDGTVERIEKTIDDVRVVVNFRDFGYRKVGLNYLSKSV